MGSPWDNYPIWEQELGCSGSQHPGSGQNFVCPKNLVELPALPPFADWSYWKWLWSLESMDLGNVGAGITNRFMLKTTKVDLTKPYLTLPKITLSNLS